jgi:hypothetical protein
MTVSGTTTNSLAGSIIAGTTVNSASSIFDNAATILTGNLSSALSNQLNGMVNLAADAAATRLGINLNPASGSTKSGTAAASSPAPTSGPTAASTNIDHFLATLDGNANVIPVPPPSASGGNSSTSTSPVETLLSKLDGITTGQTAAPLAGTSATQFDLNHYLATLDSIQPPPPALVNVTA